MRSIKSCGDRGLTAAVGFPGGTVEGTGANSGRKVEMPGSISSDGPEGKAGECCAYAKPQIEIPTKEKKSFIIALFKVRYMTIR